MGGARKANALQFHAEDGRGAQPLITCRSEVIVPFEDLLPKSGIQCPAGDVTKV